MNNYYILLTITLVMAFSSLKSQVVRCASYEHELEMQSKYPDRKSIQEFEDWIAPLVEEYKANAISRTAPAVITVPVVVHVIHNGEAVNTPGNLNGANISDAQVKSQIQVLNEDFRKLAGTPGDNSNPVGADMEIEFVLAQTDVNGNLTNGINRVNGGQASWTRANIESIIKPATYWDPTQYLNMWTVQFGGVNANLLGYAQFPNSTGLGGLSADEGGNETDGVVVGYTTFGSNNLNDGSFDLNGPYDLGRTLTHELGHWFGLRHIWGDSNCGTDYCNDTPTQQGSSSGCPSTTTCDGVQDMTENYMDYSYDVCMNVFTADQKARMQTVLAVSPNRGSLTSSPALEAPQPFIAFESTFTPITESSTTENGCFDYQDIEIQLNIGKAPSQDATVSFTHTGTATMGANGDFELIPSSVTFLAGSKASQTFILRVYDDGVIENMETVVLDFSIATTGDALNSTYYQTYTAEISDNDNAPVISATNNFTIGSGTGTTEFQSPFRGSFSDERMQYIYYASNLTAQGMVAGEISALAFNVSSKGSTQPFSNFNLQLGLTSLSQYPSAAYISGLTNVYSGSVTTSLGWNTITFDAPFYWDGTSNIILEVCWDNESASANDFISYTDIGAVIGYYARENGDIGCGLGVTYSTNFQPNTRFTLTTIQPIQASINTSSAAEYYLGPNTKIDYYDPVSGALMLTIDNTSSHDYGCTSVAIDRAGTGGTAFWDNTPSNFLADKSFIITPEFNNSTNTGQYVITVYYSEAEMNGFLAASGKTANSLELIKLSGASIPDVNPANFNSYSTSMSYSASTVYAAFNGDHSYSGTFSGFSGFGVGGLAPLPVELVKFTAKKDRSTAILNWETATEKNSSHFIVEHSSNSSDFSKLGKIEAAQNSNETINYSFTHSTPLNGLNYYRLTQVDLDGKTEQSQIVSLEFNRDQQLTILNQPIQEQLFYNYNVETAGNVKASILTISGQLVYSFSETLSLGQYTKTIDTSLLPSGVYILRVASEDRRSIHQKFVKQ